MQQAEVLSRTRTFIHQQLADDTTGHDYWHIMRVTDLAKRIAREEQADAFIVELAALLHDIGDYKLHDGDENAATRLITAWLETLQLEKPIIEQVLDIVHSISFSKSLSAENRPEPSLEAKIVSDADKLDAIGAMGIARAFTYGGHFKRVLYDPNLPPRENLTKEAYRSGQSTTLNHFYEKLLKLKDRMYTDTGKRLAAERHAFMELYLHQFHAEWQGLK